MRLHDRHRDAPPFLAVSSNVFFRQRQVHISIAFMTVPDSFLCGRLLFLVAPPP
jgi:hypothetical protein